MSFDNTIRLGWEEIMRTSSTKSQKLGTRGSTVDGRIFRYSKNGASALTVGNVVQTTAPTLFAAAQSSAPMRIPAGSTITTTMGVLSISATNMSQDTAVTANTFQDGYLYIGSTGLAGWGTGLNRLLRIDSHTGTTAISTSPIEFTLAEEERVPATLNTSNGYFGVIKNPYDSVIEVVSTAYPTAAIVGVAQCAVAASKYFWLQTWGPAMVETGAANTSAYGHIAAYSTDAAETGVISPTTATSLIIGAGNIGIFLAGGPKGGFAIVDLRLAP